MMTDQQYNEFFRKRLEHLSSPVPDHIWNTVEKSNNKSLTNAKYILLVFSLVIGIKTSDKIMHSGSLAGIVSVYKTVDKQPDSNSVVKKKSADDKEILRMNLKKQKEATYHFQRNKKTKNVIPELALHPKKQKENNNLFWEGTKENNNTTASVFNKNTDRVSEITTVNRKKQTMQNRPDSTADISVETHQNLDRLFFYFFASPDAVFSHVSSNNEVYQQQRNQEAKSQLSWSAGIRVRYNINTHWSGNIGFQYSRTNQKITLPNLISNNHYTSFDVPLILGYRIHKNRFEVDANAGIIFNIRADYKGYISSTSNEPLNIHEQKVYQSNTSLSYYAGIQFLYRPANRISLFAEPYFKYQPQNIAGSFQPFEERLQKAGVLAGARYRFTK